MNNIITDNEEDVDQSLTDERVAHIIRQVSRDFQECLESRLQPYGVNHGFWSYLRELWNEEGLSKKDLSERVNLSEPTTHSVTKRMEAAGLIEFKPIVEGKPRHLVYLSDRGRELRSILEPFAMEINDIALSGFSDDDVKQFRKLLLMMHHNLTKIPVD